ncbi:MAG: hypothetical protein ACE5GL_08440 [Calditrichia bacterium]
MRRTAGFIPASRTQPSLEKISVQQKSKVWQFKKRSWLVVSFSGTSIILQGLALRAIAYA